MKKRLAFVTLTLSLCASAAAAQTQMPDGTVYAVSDENGGRLFSICTQVSAGDEYISAENKLYRIESVSGQTAKAQLIGEESMPDVSFLDAGVAKAVFAQQAASASAQEDRGRKLIAMYVTHSDESYVPSDGTESIEGQGGIYDVAREFRDSLQALGIDVILDESTHLPHDSGAYRRSRRTAERLLQRRPDAIIDIHRDGIPDSSEYAFTIEGENASQIRLLVGRSNQNSAANREFAKQIKAVADKQYPGLIKDIFIGKGNYNQDLSPNAILLEFGTHTISKERVLNSTDLIADVVSTTLYGEQTGSAKAEASQENTPSGAESKDGSFQGIAFLLAAVVLGVVIFAFIQTGGGKAMGAKIGRNLKEMTGGIIGKKNNGDDRKQS
ncbi:MAG: stage II sporulation protein P [Clostridia bacterium]|nr:stage II sporulation protein P [Clostridia bacterium]